MSGNKLPRNWTCYFVTILYQLFPIVSSECTDILMVSDPKAADGLSSGFAHNHYQKGTGNYNLPLDYICTSTDGDSNCGIPPAYSCHLRNKDCDPGTTPELFNGMITAPTIVNNYIQGPTANGGEVRYCLVCTDGINTC